MPSFDKTFSFSEPTVVLSASDPFDHQPFSTHRHSPHLSNEPACVKPLPTSSWAQISQTLITKSSRKRSHDDIASNLDEDEHYFGSSSPIRAPEPEEWQAGEGMMLLKPNSFIVDAGSQTGTWAEEKHAEEKTEQERSYQQSRSILRNFKSQRLGHAASSEKTPCSSAASSPPESKFAPTVDDFTMQLGIGWRRISDDELIQAAARGWAKFIENNYQITAPIIRVESKGLNSYLIEAKEGFFLFGEDLKQGRLVSADPSKVVPNLQVRPPIFDGDEILTAKCEIKNTACQESTDDIAPYHSVEVDMEMN